MKTLMILLALPLGLACAQTGDAPATAAAPAGPLVMMYYNPCRDLCPVYGVMFLRDGSARYNGVERIPWPGKWVGQANPDTLLAIEQALEQADLWAITDTYSHAQRQTPATYIEYFRPDGSSVKQRVGAEHTPLLNALEPRLHEIVKAMTWQPEASAAPQAGSGKKEASHE